MTDQELIHEIVTRFRECEQAETEIRKQAKEDLEFLAGKQWPEEIKHERELQGRPCLTINQLPSYVRHVVNEARQNSPAIHIHPVDRGDDDDTADVISGLVRHIEEDSSADIAYDTARQYATACGFGAFRITTDYVSDETFDQEIKIRAIHDPFAVYCDPHAKEADRSDAEYKFVIQRLSKDEFRRRWSKAQVVSAGWPEKEPYGWITDTTVRVAEYWYVEREARKLLQLSDGTTVLQGDAASQEAMKAAGITVKRERVVHKRRIRCAITNGVEILETQGWAGEWIPIIQVFGEEWTVDNKRILLSLIRFARDSQQLFNYHKTTQAEVLQIAPKAPYVGASGQFEGHEDDWKNANRVTQAYLQYNVVDAGGKLVPPPQRNIYEPPIQALSMSAAQSVDDLKAVMGIFNPSIGAKSNETSGVAIKRRQQQSETTNFHFEDNFGRAHKHAARQILGLIPGIYDTDRFVRIIGEDSKQKVVRVNAKHEDKEGKTHHYAFSAGKYDVRITTGPTYATRRQEAFAMLTEFGRSWPDLLQLGGDIIFRNSDVPGADELADRIKRSLPPELVAEDEEGRWKMPPMVKRKMDALSKQHEELTARLNETEELLRTKRLELESKERIAGWQVQRDLILADMKDGGEQAREVLRQTVSELDRRMDQLRADEPVVKQPAAKQAKKPAQIAA